MYVCIYIYTHTYTYIFIYMTLTHGMTFWGPELHTSNLQNPGQTRKLGRNSHAITLSLTQTWYEILVARILQNPFCYKLATSRCTVRKHGAEHCPYVNTCFWRFRYSALTLVQAQNSAAHSVHLQTLLQNHRVYFYTDACRVFQMHNPLLRLWALGSAWVGTSFETHRGWLDGCSSWVCRLDFAGPNFWAPLKFST